MNSNLFRLIVTAGVCCWSQIGTAQEDLLNVYQRALQNDPIIREAENIYHAALESKLNLISASAIPPLRWHRTLPAAPLRPGPAPLHPHCSRKGTCLLLG